uniref:Ig-like domain-containing protein n=1 Tax=Suricata suricatta TaxID=37032 RepID=A0A673SSX5_SURSU
MGSRLLCWVALCLLGAGPVDSGVTQTPRHVVKAQGQQVTLRCSPISGHLSLYWYQQAVGQGPQLLIQYYDKKESNRGNFPKRFSAQQFADYHSELNMSSLELTDAALYLCASSPDTALHPPQPTVQKYSTLSSGSDGEGGGCQSRGHRPW